MTYWKTLLAFAAVLTLCLAWGLPLAAEMAPDTMRVSEMWEISSLDPAKEGTFIKEKALIAETLINAAPDFSLTPCLAESWTMVSDTVWEFQLRPGVVFHNGEQLTAEIAAWALNRDLEVNPSNAEMTKIIKVEATGDMTLRIETSELYPPLPATLVYSDMAIIHPDSEMNDQGIVTHPIGTGAYVLTEWRQAEQTVFLSRFEDYWGQMPSIDTIVYRAIPDPATRSLEVQKGDIDFIADAPYGDLDLLREAGLNVILASTARVYQIDFGSLHDTPFEDQRVRQALSHSINRQDIVDYVLFGMGRPAAGAYEDAMVFANKDLEPYAHDLDLAKSLLAEAGWTDSDGDGVLDKDGAPFAFTLYTYPQRPGLKPMAMAIQQQWKDVGLDVDVRIMDWDAIETERGPGDARLAAFASAMMPDPDYFMRRVYTVEG
ncbi:MAG: ABC transporter substrate-binding protein, partial [Desulfovibrio sp.]